VRAAGVMIRTRGEKEASQIADAWYFDDDVDYAGIFPLNFT
jgi:hypothetical protein